MKKALSPAKKLNGAPKKVATNNKKRKREDSDEEGDNNDASFEVVGRIVPAPTTGRGVSATAGALRVLSYPSATRTDIQEHAGLSEAATGSKMQ